MVQYYLAEKSLGHPDSPHIEKRAIFAVEDSKITPYRGSLNDKFEINQEGEVVCTTDSWFRIRLLTKEEATNSSKMPYGYFGRDLTKKRRPHSLREK